MVFELAKILPVLYFSALGSSACVVFHEWFLSIRRSSSKNVWSLFFLVVSLPFSLTAFYLTWTLIFDFFGEYLTKFGCENTRFSLLTCETEAWYSAPAGDTFVEAYVQVTNSVGGWVWSSSLLAFVVPSCLWVHLEGSRTGLSRTKQLAFLLLAFLGAVSASFPLAFSIIFSRRLHNPIDFHGETPAISITWLGIPSGIAILCSLLLPLTVHDSRLVYITALALLHFILIVPTLCNSTVKTKASNDLDKMKLSLIYGIICGAVAIQHVHNISTYCLSHFLVEDGLSSFVVGLVQAGWSNSCQSSISWDSVFSSIACILFILGVRGFQHLVSVLVLSVLFSPAAVFSGFLAWETLTAEKNERNKYD